MQWDRIIEMIQEEYLETFTNRNVYYGNCAIHNTRPRRYPPRATAKGNWINYTYDKNVQALAIEGNFLWSGTAGGVVKWDMTTGNYEKFTTADGLASNYVRAIAIDSTGNKWFGTYFGGASVLLASYHDVDLPLVLK